MFHLSLAASLLRKRSREEEKVEEVEKMEEMEEAQRGMMKEG